MQLAIDICVLAAAFFVTTPPVVFYSVLGAVVLNLFVAINHRADRYRAYRSRKTVSGFAITTCEDKSLRRGRRI